MGNPVLGISRDGAFCLLFGVWQGGFDAQGVEWLHATFFATAQYAFLTPLPGHLKRKMELVKLV